MTRGISSDLHGAVETMAAPAIMAAPFLLGFGQATATIAIAFGVVVLGLALSLFGPRRSVPLSAHAGLDYAIASFVIVAGLLTGLIADEPVAALFLVGVGIAHMALTASTRFSAPRTAY